MPLARTWRRMTLRASGATLLVPAIVIIALSATTLGGGLRGLAGFDQILSGPEISAAPVPEQDAGGRGGSSAGAGDLPTLPARAAADAPAGGGGSAPGGPAGSGGAGSPGPAGGGTAPSPPSAGGGTPAPTAPAGTAPSPTSAPTTATPAPSGSANPVRDAGTAGANAVGQAPGPVGSAGKDAVNSVVDIVAPAPRP